MRRMLTITGLAAVAVCFGLALAGPQEKGDGGEAADVTAVEPAAAEAPAAPEGKAVRMVRFSLGGTIVNGRLLREDDRTLEVEAPDGSSTGYAKADVRGLQ
ncbi:MAG: hypothetical protein QGH74_05680, partial [Candidatus Brocadiia bacterium]|nr:hypothetical protein [Candidatus Brocadiia bacterium]